MPITRECMICDDITFKAYRIGLQVVPVCDECRESIIAQGTAPEGGKSSTETPDKPK